MKNFVSTNFYIDSSQTNSLKINHWNLLYRYLPSNNSLKAIVLSILIKNSNAQLIDNTISLWVSNFSGSITYLNSLENLEVAAYNTTNNTSVTFNNTMADGTSPGCIYPLLSIETLSAKDEFTIDRTKHLIVLKYGQGIVIKPSASGIFAYCSVLENVN